MGDRWISDLRDVGSVCWNIGTIGNRLQGVTKALDDFSPLNMELITGIQPEEVNDQGTTSVLVTIGPQTTTRKNSLFAGSEGGGRTWATLGTLLQTARMNNVDPLDWLSQTLARIAQGWPASKIDALMPWNFRSNALS
jgi:hypothetical protein